MNYVDIVLVILLILSAINGFSKGFVEELSGLVALILGIWVAIHFSDFVGQFLISTFHFTFKHLQIVAFFITFILVVIIVQIIGSVVNKMVKAISLGFLNRLAGLAFGAVKGALILSVLLVVFDKIDKDVHIISVKTKAESKLYTPIRNFAPGVFPFLDFWKEDSNL
jgi:membrane protein required for colicin V production